MRKLAMCIGLLVVLCVTGCGNVYLRGEALTAVELSAMDAYQAMKRADAEPATPAWEKGYLTENYVQWRCFVRSARKDEAWGPALPSETPTTARSGG
jgi:hypothetical protein